MACCLFGIKSLAADLLLIKPSGTKLSYFFKNKNTDMFNQENAWSEIIICKMATFFSAIMSLSYYVSRIVPCLDIDVKWEHF